ncbi:hypothetical protein PHYPSEUDO_008458 [Phytophthora pseudosyringae]|uniref:Uncharacterized protein n=1 Tax=Phytophthora pseudosyringae TaxID=221518 RepID=A0A8T1VE47_9STRA|nr:hypothetical protein PHYPSEUDO_008458 [Phytophthora pseudosyringae]
MKTRSSSSRTSTTTTSTRILRGDNFACYQGDPKGNFEVPTATGDCACEASIGRDCELNVLTESGDLKRYSENAVSTQISTYKKQIGEYKVSAATQFSRGRSNFGIGDLKGGVSQSSGSSGEGEVGARTDSSVSTQ